MEEIVYLNGHLMPRSEARLSPFDHGFLYGYGLFETMRAYNGSIFRLDRHLGRLHDTALSLGLAPKTTAFDLKKGCYDVLRANNLTEARIRLTVSAGEGDITPNPDTCHDITVVIVARKLIPLSPESYERGYKGHLSTCRRNSQSPASQLKSICYLENILARREARAEGSDEAVLLNEKGHVAEGSSTNIFMISKQILITPSLDSGVLPGVTREAVLEISHSIGLTSEVRQVELEELYRADEVFLTNSIIEIMPLTYLDIRSIGSGKPGPITQRLMSSYREIVARETQPGDK